MDIIDREFRSVPHEDKLYSRPVMDTNVRAAILERNKRLEIEKPQRDLDGSFGRQALSIPVLDLMHVLKRWPDLASPDGQIKKRAILEFLKSPESEPYRV